MGVAIAPAVEAFCRAFPQWCSRAPERALSVLEWLQIGRDGLDLADRATQWLLGETLKTRNFDQQPAVMGMDDAHMLAPIPNPGKVICAAGNFPAPGALEKPRYPTFFLKPSSSVTGHNQPVILPELAQNVAYEVELAVIIGRRARNITAQEAASYIAGYTIANDLGDRDLEQRTSQWASGKMFDTFTPMGPVIVTPDEIYDVNDLVMQTKLNDKLVQNGCTGDMFFSVEELISQASQLTTLQPGDVLLCGSPKMMYSKPNPVIALQPGDQMELRFENLGTLNTPVIREERTQA